MTATERVRATRRLLGGGAIARALAWGAATTFSALAAIAFVSLLAPDLAYGRGWPRALSLVAGLAVTLTLLWRARHLRSSSRVALWIEERIPALEYALVTALEQGGVAYAEGRITHVNTRTTHVKGRTTHEQGSTTHTQSMETLIARHDIAGVTRDALRRTVVPALGAAAVAAALLYVSPSSAFGRGYFSPSAGVTRPGGVLPPGTRLGALTVQVTPPSYTGQRSATLDDPSSVTALIGSRVIVQGRAGAAGITGTLGNTALVASPAGEKSGWAVSFAIPNKPVALTLRDRGFERIIVIDPRADAPPRVVLTSPQRDSTLRVARLVLQLTASATDDIGLTAGYFEYLVSSGSGEIFTARTITSPVRRFGGARTGSLTATLDLGTLALGQGDVVSIRAMVQDGNTPTGPGLATSDTRTYRIARADEYDSVSVDAAGPPPVDSSAMSQRMLIIMTEQLVREQKRLTRAQLVRRSTEIAGLEDRIRLRLHEILFPHEAHPGAAGADPGAPPEDHAHSDEEAGPRNADLLLAYNAIWEAVRALRVAEPSPALPPMRRALVALDRVRLANRLYLRGTPPKVIVDLARVRMTGKEKGAGSVRTPLPPVDSARARLQTQFGQALALLPDRASDGVRALTLLQVDGLSIAPSFAAALGDALEAFRRGRDATLPLLRARRALSGEPEATTGLPVWSGGS